MARKKKPVDSGPSNAYLLSFGDTMTTLLAFFIVLNSLAEEQTGANLYSGTGSFVSAMQSFGMPGSMPGTRSRNAISKQASSPLYVVPPDNSEEGSNNNPLGPDPEDDGLRVVDREADDFERFMNEMDRLSEVDQLESTAGEAAFDFFEPLNSEPPYMTRGYERAVDQILPLLYQQKYRVEVVVWATTPSPTAWRRATRQSRQFADEIAQLGQLPLQSRHKILASGQPWIDSEAKRPVLSITVRKSG